MKIFAYVVRDRLLGSYGSPIFDTKDKTEQVAGFKAGLLRYVDKFDPSFHDSELYYLGVFDNQTAELDFLAKPEYLCDLGAFYVAGIEYQQKVNKERLEAVKDEQSKKVD